MNNSLSGTFDQGNPLMCIWQNYVNWLYFWGISNCGLVCVFVKWLPNCVKQLLHVSSSDKDLAGAATQKMPQRIMQPLARRSNDIIYY